MKPLCIELFAGCFGWSAGWLELGGRSVGFDIEHLPHHGPVPSGAELVLQDVLTLHGSQFKKADLILASPPCQFFSRMAMPFKMPWSQPEYERRRDLSLALFHSCFRIQREASEAADRYIPMIVENVCGAQKWVGQAPYHYGSYYLWGDIPALMPAAKTLKVPGFRFDGSGKSFQTASVKEGHKSAGMNWSDRTKHGQDFTRIAGKQAEGVKVGVGPRYQRDCRPHLTNPAEQGIKFGGGWWNDSTTNLIRKASSKSSARKAASAQIAKIPYALSSWIAQVFKPEATREACA